MYDPTLSDPISRIRMAVGDTGDTSLLNGGETTYQALLAAAAQDEAAATRSAAAALAAQYASQPDTIAADGTTLRWSQRVAQWNLIAQGSAVAGAGSSSPKTARGAKLRHRPACLTPETCDAA